MLPDCISATHVSKETIIELVWCCFSYIFFTFTTSFLTHKLCGDGFTIFCCDHGTIAAMHRGQMYVDEVFLVLRNKDLSKLLSIDNLIDSIQFIIEKWTKYRLSFIDVYIDQKEDTADKNLSAFIYCK